jgi:hypothetical protein
MTGRGLRRIVVGIAGTTNSGHSVAPCQLASARERAAAHIGTGAPTIAGVPIATDYPISHPPMCYVLSRMAWSAVWGRRS